jgi:lyso-ornithine lipid O-acyltransferase
MIFRMSRRAVALGLALALIFLRYWFIRVRGPLSLERRALWLQWACGLVLRSLGIRFHPKGPLPGRGLVVSNHLSYLDILILSAAMPCFFVAKKEISCWPYFGWAARSGGTLFLDRASHASAAQVAAAIAERLALPVPILFFPEGTSTDGSSVLRFHSWLFEPAVRSGASVTPAAVRYVLADAGQERDLCWFGDDAFLPHLWKVLGASGFTAEVQFGEPGIFNNRRIAARQTHAEVAAMRTGNLVLR